MHRTILSALALTCLAAPLKGQGWIDVPTPRVPSQSNPSISRVASDVRSTIEGRIVRVEVEERFRNTGGRLAEGSYLYPLPGEAVFQNFSLWMGEQEVRGEMMNAEQARGMIERGGQQDPGNPRLAAITTYYYNLLKKYGIQP